MKSALALLLAVPLTACVVGSDEGSWSRNRRAVSVLQ
jgi:hypothetical protein